MKNTLLYLFLFSSCISSQQPVGEKFITRQMVKARGTINISKRNDIKWTKLYVIPPYASPASFDPTLTVFKSKILDTGIQSEESFTILAFFDDDKLVDLFKFTSEFRSLVIGENGKLGFYSRKDCLFKYKRYRMTEDPDHVVHLEFNHTD